MKQHLFSLLLAAGALCLASSCTQKPAAEEPAHKHQHDGHQHGKKHQHPAMSRNDENILWAKFDSISDEQKRIIINQKLQRINTRDSVTMSRISEFQQQVKYFDKMSFDEQRALLETREKTQEPLSEEQLAERRAKLEELKQKHAAQNANGHNHNHAHGHDGHNHNGLKPVNLNLPNGGSAN